MFGLLYNLYKYLREKSERKITLVLLGLDNAGKTTILNSLKGEFGVETSPTYGFDSSWFVEGKYKVHMFDLGGGKNIRRIWKVYLAEVHGVMYVVDAADEARFEEAKAVLQQTLSETHLADKPIVIFANKQDLPTAATASTVAQALGLDSCHRNTFNIIACTAKTAEGSEPDSRVREGMKWVISTIDNVFTNLDLRVQREADAARQEELRKKKEREDAARKAREERLRLEKLEAEKEEEAATENLLRDGKGNSAQATVTIPNYVDSTTPKGDKPTTDKVSFTDLTQPKQDVHVIPSSDQEHVYNNPSFEGSVRHSPSLHPQRDDSADKPPSVAAGNRVAPDDAS